MFDVNPGGDEPREVAIRVGGRRKCVSTVVVRDVDGNATTMSPAEFAGLIEVQRGLMPGSVGTIDLHVMRHNAPA